MNTFSVLHRLKESTGWILAWTSPYLEHSVERLALNAKAPATNLENCNRMLAVSYGSMVQLWSVNASLEGPMHREIGDYLKTKPVQSLLFDYNLPWI